MIVFLRHADDEVGSVESGCEHDHAITKKGRKESKKFMKAFVKKYGQPDEIRCTPFRRGTQTLEAMRKHLSDKVKITIDPDLSRFFNNSEKRNPGVHKDTLKYKPPIMESRKDFHKRNKNYFKQLKKDGYLEKDKLIIVLTHFLVLKDAAFALGVSLPEKYDFLEYFVLRSNKKGEIVRVDK